MTLQAGSNFIRLRHATPLPKPSLHTKKYCSSITMAFIVINSQPQSYCLFCLIVVFIHYLALHSLSSSSATRLLMKLLYSVFCLLYITSWSGNVNCILICSWNGFTETGAWKRIVLRGDRMPALQEHTVISYKVFFENTVFVFNSVASVSTGRMYLCHKLLGVFGEANCFHCSAVITNLRYCYVICLVDVDC